MPSRSFFSVPDQLANQAILNDVHMGMFEREIAAFVARGIAPLVDEKSLSQLLGIGYRVILDISRRKEHHYRSFPLKKRNGCIREIHSPRTYLKVIHWWILDNILCKVEFPGCVSGFVRGRGIYYNAELHIGAKHMLNMDLKDFFRLLDRSE